MCNFARGAFCSCELCPCGLLFVCIFDYVNFCHMSICIWAIVLFWSCTWFFLLHWISPNHMWVTIQNTLQLTVLLCHRDMLNSKNFDYITLKIQYSLKGSGKSSYATFRNQDNWGENVFFWRFLLKCLLILVRVTRIKKYLINLWVLLKFIIHLFIMYNCT